jgi:hypothetical protein
MIYTGAIDVLTVRRGFRKATMWITGPNDASSVVWALGEFFFSIRDFYILNDIFTGTTDALKVRRGSWKTATTITGPNDAYSRLCPR